MSTFAGSSQNAPLPQGQESSHHGPMGFLKDLISKILQNDGPGLAAEMAYNWMLALFPLLILMVSLFGLFTANSNLFEQMMTNLSMVVPGQAYTLIRETLQEVVEGSSGGLALAGLAGALWAGSNGAMAVEKALNRAYRCGGTRRNIIQKRLVALAIVVGMALILLVFSNLIVFGDMIYAAIEDYWNLSGWLMDLLSFALWAIPIGGLLLISGYIYTIAPEHEHKGAWKRVWPGALTFVLLWIGISWLFGLYVSNMANYNRVYGPLGAIVVLMIWLYLTSFALLIGGEVNAIRNACDEGSLNPPPEPRA